MRTSPVQPAARRFAVVAAFVALLCAPPLAGAASELISALGSSKPPFVPLSEEEAHHALERDLLLKVGKHLQTSDYPGEARRWRWTGTVLVEVLVAADGMVKQVALSRTSGFRVLDMQALEVVRRVSKLFVPIGLRQRDRTVTVPVSFYLQKS
ncbi:MAG TPA: energy transducer TonB [Burkholderiales bacterium]|jgi:protein TonB